MIDQKVAIITGGTKGIGYEISVHLAKDGCALAIMGRSEQKRVKNIITKLGEYGQPILYYSGDLTFKKDREKFINKVIKRYGRIDILVNNAGVAPKKRNDILQMTEESYDFVIDVNLKGTLFITQKVANFFINNLKYNKSFKPKIVNIASISSYTSSTSRGEYCISKAGISMLTKLFADRLAEYGICVYEVRPGVIYTDMTKNVKDKYDELIKEGLTPIKRWGYPEDVAKVVSTLCSGKFDFSTGEVINVDGGFHLRRL